MRLSLERVMPLALLALLGCGRPSEDASRVLANVGGAKITEAELGKLVSVLIKDPTQAQAFLVNADKRQERSALLEQMATSKAIFQFARMEGLDQDGKVQARIESAVAQVYFNTLLERRAATLTPTEADLKATYDRLAMKAKLQGQANVPPYDERLRPNLEASWQQQQQQRLAGELQKELLEKVPMTFAENEVGGQ